MIFTSTRGEGRGSCFQGTCTWKVTIPDYDTLRKGAKYPEQLSHLPNAHSDTAEVSLLVMRKEQSVEASNERWNELPASC